MVRWSGRSLLGDPWHGTTTTAGRWKSRAPRPMAPRTLTPCCTGQPSGPPSPSGIGGSLPTHAPTNPGRAFGRVVGHVLPSARPAAGRRQASSVRVRTRRSHFNGYCGRLLHDTGRGGSGAGGQETVTRDGLLVELLDFQARRSAGIPATRVVEALESESP